VAQTGPRPRRAALAITGIAGILAFDVSRRGRETAVRRALDPPGGGVVGSGMRLAASLTGTDTYGQTLHTLDSFLDENRSGCHESRPERSSYQRVTGFGAVSVRF
jgi:hypothetical protein